MNILYISYWGIEEGLTHSAVIPYLSMIHHERPKATIYLATFERNGQFKVPDTISKEYVEHVPLVPKYGSSYLRSKLDEFTGIPKALAALVQSKNIDLIVAKTSLAGAVAYKVHQKTKVPFVVESFEPHSDYMNGCGIWSKYDVRYWFTRHFERKQMAHANHLVTVTHNYRNYLVEQEHLDAKKVHVIPCIVDLDKFCFKADERNALRKKHNIPTDAMVGVYLGKFGGLYFEDEAFELFKEAFELISNFHLLVLTGSTSEYIAEMVAKHKLPAERVTALKAQHDDVPNYLSVADFGFSTIRTMPFNVYQSPIKHGEYWACELPILLSDKMADDYRIVNEEGGGAILALDGKNTKEALLKVQELSRDVTQKTLCRTLATKYRHSDLARAVYTITLHH